MQHRNMPVVGVTSFAFLVILFALFSISNSKSVRAADKPAATKPGPKPEFSDEYLSHPSDDEDQKAIAEYPAKDSAHRSLLSQHESSCFTDSGAVM